MPIWSSFSFRTNTKHPANTPNQIIPCIHRELARPGVTLTLLWEEYCVKYHETGRKPYMSTQFGERYRHWVRITKATIRIQHKSGDALQVDWAGDAVPIHDPVTWLFVCRRSALQLLHLRRSL